MTQFKPPRSLRRHFSTRRPEEPDFFRADPADGGESDDQPRHEPMSPSKRRKLRKEMDQAVAHFFGSDPDLVGQGSIPTISK